MRTSGTNGIALVTLGNLAPPAVALITAPILAQSLGVAGRGELAAATAPLFLAASGFSFGIPDAVTHFVAKERPLAKRYLSIGGVVCFVLGIIGSLVIAFASPLMSQNNSDLRGLIVMSGLALAPSLLASCLRGFARGTQLWPLVAMEQVVSASFRLVSIVLLAYSGHLTTRNAALITAFAASTGALVYLRALVTRHVSEADSESGTPAVPPSSTTKRMMKFGLGVWLGAAAGTLLSKLDMVLILPLSNAPQLGLYAVAVSIAEVIRIFNMAVRDVVFSMQSARNDDALLAMASRASTLLTACGAVAVATSAIWLVPMFFGDAFNDAVPVIAVLALGTLLGNPGSVLAAGLSARGKPIMRSLAIIGGVSANILGLLLLVPTYGAIGAACASAFASSVTATLVLLFAKYLFNLSPKQFLLIRISDLSFVISRLKRR